MNTPPGRSPILALLEAIHARYAGVRDGAVADYIPELSRVDPDLFGICIATADGAVYEAGDSRHEFTIQSISKPFVYGLALDDHGADFMHTKVGVEPSGDAFNAISLHKKTGRPLNPMINAGAIATTGQIKAASPGERIERILDTFARYTGRRLSIDRAVYESEAATGHRNRAIGHLLRNFDVLDGDPMAAVDVYFQQCSINVRCIDLALIGATLANQGLNPVTRERAIADDNVEHVLSVMASCGMYDFSGRWIYEVGMPAKSGVGGGVVAVLPGQFGIGVFSPRLDDNGNSVRAIAVCRELSRLLQLHQFDPPHSPQASLRLSYSAADRHSTRVRPPTERACLRDHGERIGVCEIQGNLAFATIEPIIRRITGLPAGRRTVILDFRHVTAINEASARLLADLVVEGVGRGIGMFFTHTGPIPSLRAHVSRCLSGPAESDRLFRFPTTDQALEWCEDELLAEVAPPTSPSIRDLRTFEIAAGLTDEELAVFGGLLTNRSYESGETIIRAGEESQNLFLLRRGIVSVWLGTLATGRRIASFSAGTMVGELAFIDGERRSVDVVADGRVECCVFEIDDFLGLRETHPRIHATILRNIAASLAHKLRQAARHIDVLSPLQP